MRIIMTLLVRDEQDILPANIEYHLSQGVDFIIATDNLSRDATPAILKHYERSGVLRYILETADDYSQHEWVTRMARMAFDEYDADWVINNDADEFWWPQQGNLRDFFAQQPSEIQAMSVERVNFIARPHTEKRWFVDSMTVREVHSLNAVGKPLPPKTCHRGRTDIEVGQGNHDVSVQGQVQPAQRSEELLIFHFPLRTYAQFANKIQKGGAAYERNTQLAKAIGITWRNLYEKYQHGELRDYVLQTQMPSKQDIQTNLQEGSYVQDTRLRDYLREMDAAKIRSLSYFSQPLARLYYYFRYKYLGF